MRRLVTATAILLVSTLLWACSSSAPTPTADDLVAKLGILRTQQGFTDAQVRCVADKIEATLHGKDLRAFDQQLVELKDEGSTAGMSPRSLTAFTEAISACTVAGG